MIAIKDMEMPKSCADCDLCRGHICKVTGTDVVANSKNNCPLTDIVTCENCKHNGYSSVTRIYCKLHKWYPCSDYYCSDGEKRMSEESKDQNFVPVTIEMKSGQRKEGFLYKPQNLVVTEYITVELIKALGWKVQER